MKKKLMMMAASMLLIFFGLCGCSNSNTHSAKPETEEVSASAVQSSSLQNYYEEQNAESPDTTVVPNAIKKDLYLWATEGPNDDCAFSSPIFDNVYREFFRMQSHGLGLAVYNDLDNHKYIICTTDDYAQTWQIHSFVANDYAYDCAVHNNHAILTGSDTTYISSDYGNSFNEIYSTSEIYCQEAGNKEDDFHSAKFGPPEPYILAANNDAVTIAWVYPEVSNWTTDYQVHAETQTLSGDVLDYCLYIAQYDWHMHLISPVYDSRYDDFYRPRYADFAGYFGKYVSQHMDGFLLENSSEEYLSHDETAAKLAVLWNTFGDSYSKSEVQRLAINEIYARKGYDFSDSLYWEYFSNMDWYTPVKGKIVEESELTAIEKSNIDLLVSIEAEFEQSQSQGQE